jgi:hypothetical protein
MNRCKGYCRLAALLIALAATHALGETRHGFDLQHSLVPIEEIYAGGPPRDGIPALDEPDLVRAAKADFLVGEDRVLGVAVPGGARAYPIKILNWHEIVNDELAGRPIAVTYCPLCGTGIVFDARVAGRTLDFGVSGLLYNSDVLLYDRQTESLWSQIRQEAITGPLRGVSLAALPVTHTTWRAWREAHPGTLVLSTATGHDRDYSRDPYGDYGQTSELYFPVSARSDRFHAKEWVLGIEIDGRFKAYPFSELAKSGRRAIRDQFNGHSLLIRFDPVNRSATAHDAAGRQLPAVPGFWFAWYAFHPETEVFTAERRR